MSQSAANVTSREPMSRQRVLEAAIGLADRGGIASLSMRKLAQELGVEAMTLYYYVANKDEILDGIVDMVVGEMELPPADMEWKAAVRHTAISAHEVLQAHPWAAALLLSPSRVSQARLRYMDALLGTLRGAGFSAEMTDHAYHALDSHVMGFTLWVVGMNLDEADLEEMASSFLADLPREELPHLAEHVEQHLRPRDPDDEGDFVFGLDLILEGLERRLG
ncbi:MAG: TetR/AcrR family transcriptional regulator C-terminal domain-containing protein [Chloroflexi bacterium]|nr:TetR/AcrR family transcriptional regulator C-terminal domain-containing protein [Chloroflexota bacterium]